MNLYVIVVFSLLAVDGYDLAWSTMELTIEVGDIVQWEWSVSFQGVELHLFQTASNVSIDQLPGGFQSERQSSGSYSNKFTEPGTYYYLTQLTSALTSPVEPIRGTIYVTDLQSSVAEIQVFVAGFEAVYNIAGTEDDSLSPLAKRSTHQSSSICSDPEQASNEPDVSQLDLQQSPSYAYSVCHTPTVSSVSPRDVTLATVITISGVGFSQTEAQNVVMFGQHRCNVVNSGESQIRCLLDGSNPPAFVELPLSLNVDGLGNAHVQRPAEATITVRPTITDVSPTQGSIQGGTDITILGTAFPSNGLQVWIGSYACAIKSNSYTQICCSSTGTNSNLELELNITVFLNDSSKSAQCNIAGGCMFEYSLAHTPNVSSVSPATLRGPGTITLTVFGTGFSATPGENEVYVGQSACETVDSNSTHVTCELDSLPAGSYELSMRICTRASNCTQCQGNASSNRMLTSVGEVHAVVPSTGSIMGGTEITISGLGFYTNTQVSIGGSSCMVSLSNYTTVTCKTSAHQAGTHTITITSGGMSFPQTVSFEYALSSTPQVAEILPSSGQQGQEATISGSGFSSLAEDNSVMIGGSECVASASSENTIQCTLGANFVGDHELVVSVSGMGDAMGDVDFSYLLEVDSISPTEGSLAGLNTMTVNGKGFDPNQISISVCGNLCQLSTNHPTLTEVECIVPPHSDIELAENDIEECNVIVESLGESQTMVNGYTFQQNLTAVVRKINRTRGGTQGGSRILIEGVGFTNTRAANVTIAGAQCEVLEKDDEHIVCETGASGRTVRAQVLVYIEGKGYAMSRDVIFWYVDLWSSTFTWGGGPLPRAGDFVIIPQGQTLVLDVKTPVLAYLLIQGGELIFDDEQEDDAVELHTEGVLIVNGGKLQVGTEENPFQHRTQIVLYGNVLSTEIPVYGAKTLAVRQGVLDLHGRPLNVTWTKLRQTANPSDTTLYLQDSVDWEVGGTIVLAATSFSQRENEELKITAIDETGTVLSISPPLQYKHISIQQVIEGRDIDTSAEVGYLTRNVVVRGNINYDTVGQVESCDEEFRPGQFEVQTCFLGRFGAETVDDQFGSQIMIHAAEQNRGDVIGRLEYIEVTHAGQAFRLGRYPIHFHLNGNVSGSYVRGCGIHHTFNRAVTIHAVDYLLVEKNVAYNILGHAYFLEDGIEQHNIIQDNLGVFVRASSSLLNVDITPATFWIVNPNNIVRRNAAAGGTHFGFWYRLPQNPTGPSATGSVCPRNLPLEEFSNNTAHSFGWYGLWVFPHYAPRAGGGCNDQQHTPVVFENFLSWRNDRGVEFGEVGSLQLTGSILLDNKLAGFEVTELEAVWGENGPLIADTLIVGHSDISSDDATCTESGIKTPHSYFLTVSGVTFVNFDRPECYPIQACSHCKDLQGGFETRYERIRMVNSGSQLTKWQWEHEHVHRDLDGSLTGAQGPSLLIPSNDLLPPERCQHHPGSAFGSVNGSICDGTLQFGRFALFDPLPDSLEFTNANLSNEHGTVVLQYRQKRLLSTGAGYMSVVQLNRTYQLIWPEGQQFTNFSYSELFSGFLLDDYIILSQTFPRSLDMITIGGVTSPANSTALDDPATAEIGDWYIDENNTLFYIIKGRTNEPDNIPVTFSTSRCFYEDCTPPPPPTLPPPIPPGRPNVTYNWSDVTIWPGEQLPQAGDDIYINCSVYILVNTQVPRLGTVTVCGGLEFLDTMNHVFEVDLIIIQGGRLVAGYPETPFVNTMRFVLHGSLSSPEFQFVNGPSLGAKAIGVFGELILHSRLRTYTWTKLAMTAMAGSTQITVTDSVDWQPDEEIVVTSTSFEARETEVFKIMSVSSTGTLITLNASLQNTHSGESQTVGSRSYSVRAEVGLLTRNIVIESGDRALTDDEAFGCRVLVSNFIDDESSQHYVGSAQIGGVEFRHCGQLGYTDSFDPRFALAFLNRGPISGYSTYVQNSSFHDGYNTAIGVFGTNGILLENNIIHSTVGPSVWVTGSHHIVNRNLASLAIFIGTYRNRNEPMNSLWTANFELTGAANLTLIGNVASGGAKAGFHTNGEECATASDNPQIADNVAHSTLHGVHLGYRDGYASGCSKFSRYTLFSCYHYGLFSYGIAGIWVTEATLVNNFAGIFAHVIGPPSLSHVLGNKEVRIEDSLIVSASVEFNCSQDSVVPIISEHPLSNMGLRSPSRGHVGIVVPSFVSGRGHFPPQAWFSIISYPAVNGSTTIQNVAFVNFRQRCDTKKDVVLMTNPGSEDCIHPVHLKQIHFTNVSSDSKLFNHNPHLGSVNPSDCVDMDCDGLKHVLFRDEDGSFSEESGPRTFISKAEFEWGGDPRRGIGDYRIPRTMLTYANGSSINVNQTYPKKGVVRGNEFGNDSQCIFSEIWNMYHCAGLDHLMLILESLDADTEVRRLSPIGVGANGFIDLLNGPQDHGWCGGYTCQERISTFYGIVASNYSYTVGLTSTNPQNMALHLLHSSEFQVIVVGIIYTNPQRLDVYYGNTYVVPNNAEQAVDGNLMYMSGSPEEFTPSVSSSAGSNFYDRDLKRLYITVRGKMPYRIETIPVIQVSLTLQVTVDDFFGERLVQNLAFLLGIDQSRIRIVNVVRETVRRKRQTGTSSPGTTFDIEIGNPPPIASNETAAVTNTTSNDTTQEPQNATTVLTFEMLEEVATTVVEVIQTGELAEDLNTTVVSATIMEPEPPQEDPTGGVRATNTTGGLQPDDVGNDTSIPTYYDQQIMMEVEERNETAAIAFSIPTRLVIIQQPGGAVEGLVFTRPARVQMYDNNNRPIQTLGLRVPWVLTAAIRSGPGGAFLAEASANIVNGLADFTNLSVSHHGSYTIVFTVTYPSTADFSVVSEPFVAGRRQLELRVSTQPSNGNTTFLLFPYPAVQLVDSLTNEVVTEHTWRNRRWYVTADVQHHTTFDSLRSWNVPLVSGEAQFTEILVLVAGTYRILFTAVTEPITSQEELPQQVSSNTFTVSTLPVTRINVTYDEDFSTVLGNNESMIEPFIMRFQDVFYSGYSTSIEIFNITVTEGSIIVSFFATTQQAADLAAFVQQVTSNFQALSFTFNGNALVPSNITQDPAYPIVFPTVSPATEDQLILILATTIPSGTILFATILLIIVVILCQRHQRKNRVFKMHVKPTIANPAFEEHYVEHNGDRHAVHEDVESMDEFFLVPDHKLQDLETQSFEEHEMANLYSVEPKREIVVSQEIKVRGNTTLVNPYASGNKVGKLDLANSLDEIWNRSANANSNQNNNTNTDYDSQARMHLPNVVVHPEEESEFNSSSRHSGRAQSSKTPAAMNAEDAA